MHFQDHSSCWQNNFSQGSKIEAHILLPVSWGLFWATRRCLNSLPGNNCILKPTVQNLPPVKCPPPFQITLAQSSYPLKVLIWLDLAQWGWSPFLTVNCATQCNIIMELISHYTNWFFHSLRKKILKGPGSSGTF